MPDRINPRPLFRRALSLLEDARCPECGRAFDPVQDAETDCRRMVPLHCSWCSSRLMLIHEYRAWQHQDASIRRMMRD